MVDLARDPRDPGDMVEEAGEPKKYYPICIYLMDEEVKKLGLEKAEAGEQYSLTARVLVKSSEKRADDNKVKSSLDLALMTADLKKVSSKKSSADTLYSSDDEEN